MSGAVPKPVVLFDLDGTLIDSAPDLAGAANDLRLRRGLPPMPQADLRPMVGAGARGMVGRGLGLGPGDAGYDDAREEFLAIYAGRLLRETRVFDSVVPLLRALTEADVSWGIVTNKVARFAEPVIAGLGLREQVVACVCGDTTPHAKPHPAPMLEAARQAGVAPVQCLYVGDDLRDIQAGRAAGMRTYAAAWGYLGDGEGPHAWGADAVLPMPMDLLHHLELP